jgi:hypothetical protein
MYSRRIRFTVHVAHLEERRGASMVLMRTAEGNTPLGKPKCEWEDSLSAGLQEVR